jgi:Tol biopolymer transport system component
MPTDEDGPVWSPDGKRVAFQSNRGDGTYRIYMKEADGSGAREKVFDQPPDSAAERKDAWADDWSPDGRYLLVGQAIWGAHDRERRLSVLDLVTNELTPLAASEGTVGGNFSQDGRWLAFSLFHDGKDQVFVSRFSEEPVEKARNAGGTRFALDGVARWQISYEGGSRPRWRGDGKELYYVRADNILVAVALELEGESLRVGASTPLFAAAIRFRDYAYDVTLDGQRFLLNTQGAGTKTPLVLVTGWSADLER